MALNKLLELHLVYPEIRGADVRLSEGLVDMRLFPSLLPVMCVREAQTCEGQDENMLALRNS